MLNEKNKKVIAVQSVIPGEGKSFISMNLASVLAMNNLKVLLVGVDMRRSKLNQVFQRDNKKGLSTYLSNQDTFDDVIENTSVANLKFVASGPIPPNPAELLENDNFDQFIEKAKSRFDYIVLDSPPVSLVADGIITGLKADINLFVLRFRYSSKDQVQFLNSIENLPSSAILLNDAIKENFSSGNYYSKSNHYYEE
jgi:capsular exopolysaccharide synthesis family protein